MVDVGRQAVFVDAVMCGEPVGNHFAAVGRSVAIDLGTITGELRNSFLNTL